MARQILIPFRSVARGLIATAICLTHWVPSRADASAARIQTTLAVLVHQFLAAPSLPEGTRPTPRDFNQE